MIYGAGSGRPFGDFSYWAEDCLLMTGQTIRAIHNDEAVSVDLAQYPIDFGGNTLTVYSADVSGVEVGDVLYLGGVAYNANNILAFSDGMSIVSISRARVISGDLAGGYWAGPLGGYWAGPLAGYWNG